MRNAETLQKIRKRYGKSREEFAERLGIGVSTLRDWERGKPPGTGIGKMLEHLEADVGPMADELRAWATGPPPPERQEPPVPTKAENESPAAPVTSPASPEPPAEALRFYFEEELTVAAIRKAVKKVLSYPESVSDALIRQVGGDERAWKPVDWNYDATKRAAILREVIGTAEESRKLKRPDHIKPAIRSVSKETVDVFLDRLACDYPNLFPPVPDLGRGQKRSKVSEFYLMENFVSPSSVQTVSGYLCTCHGPPGLDTTRYCARCKSKSHAELEARHG